MTPSLAVYMFGFDLDKIRYPYLASIASALDLVGPTGAVYYCYCLPMGDSSPMKVIREFGDAINAGRLKIIDHPWGTHHSIQAYIANALLDEIGHKQTYALKMDMDEVACEWTFDDFWHDLEEMDKHGVLLARPNYIHFCPDDRTVFPFIYPDKAVISRTDNGTGKDFRFDLRIGGDACALGGAPEYSTHLKLHHYGKMSMGREREALYKERSFQAMYEELGFPDPKVKAQWDQGYIDYMKVFDVAASRGEFQPYVGQHPIFVRDWLGDMRQRHEQFVNELEDDGA